MPLRATSSSAHSARRRAASSFNCFSFATAASFSAFNSATIWSSSGLKNAQDGPVVLAPCAASSPPSPCSAEDIPLVVRNAVVSMNRVEPSTAAKSFDWRNLMAIAGPARSSIPEALRVVLAGERHGRPAVDEIVDQLALLIPQVEVMTLALAGQQILHGLALLAGVKHPLTGLIQFDVGEMEGLFALPFAFL